MTSFYLSQHCSEPLIERGQDHQSQLHDPFALATDTASFPFPILFNAPQDQEDHHSQQQLLLQVPKSTDLLMIGETSDRSVSSATNYYNYEDHATIDRPMYDPYVRDDDPQGSGKWMSSKMRIMRKMLSSDRIITSKPRRGDDEVVHRGQVVLQDQQKPNYQESSSSNNSISPSGIIRVCSDCNTTKTPLWRSGPRGPKSLCNACGIRQRKARRAMAAAAAAALGGGLVPAEKKIKVPKYQKRSEVDRTVPFKKRCRFSTAGTADRHDQKQLRIEDMTINSGKGQAMHRVFPQDEKDAAILLMALSCGLIHT